MQYFFKKYYTISKLEDFRNCSSTILLQGRRSRLVWTFSSLLQCSLQKVCLIRLVSLTQWLGHMSNVSKFEVIPFSDTRSPDFAHTSKSNRSVPKTPTISGWLPYKVILLCVG
ncbi:uncharacterized protein FOMMEDRAFT_166836 [Fomitiporia mediterranea MF3/22]|uniref:uncharacterized protein n=1 Tax=Fomitiporia mediterranea (strain MF3/22) TaxID=694068 RepID=UPI0004408FFB|nr:uncharacterized protein FOMMEDRAFT_166836 [Fomitiporia mediterranea MF3/22]EJD05222.1 hypothetical protein FOMMEDRAFT_166836 [Fomitiporia mediterranea MF3/22]